MCESVKGEKCKKIWQNDKYGYVIKENMGGYEDA